MSNCNREGGGLMTENIDNDDFYRIASKWKAGDDSQWSNLIQRIDDYVYGEVEAAVALERKRMAQAVEVGGKMASAIEIMLPLVQDVVKTAEGLKELVAQWRTAQGLTE